MTQKRVEICPATGNRCSCTGHCNIEALNQAKQDMILYGTGVFRLVVNKDGTLTFQHVPFEEMQEDVSSNG